MTRTVRLVAAGAPAGELEFLVRELPRYLPVLPAVAAQPLHVPDGRVNALQLLERVLQQAHADGGALWLAVAAASLHGEGTTGEVFGQATVNGPAGVVTAFGADGSPRARSRLLTSAVHELGHMLGLEHCHHPACAMYPSRQVSDTDRKGPGICDRCDISLQRHA